MNEIDKLLVENLLEALRQIQNYLVLAFGTSASALALAVTLWKWGKRQEELRPKLVPEPAPKEKPEQAPEHPEVVVPGIAVALDPYIAEAVFLALTCVAGLMAGYAAQSATVIVSRLPPIHGLLQAPSPFPSIATSPYPAVRFIPVVLPPLLASCAACLELRREKAAPTAFGAWLVFIIVPYFLLGLALHRPGWAL